MKVSHINYEGVILSAAQLEQVAKEFALKNNTIMESWFVDTEKELIRINCSDMCSLEYSYKDTAIQYFEPDLSA